MAESMFNEKGYFIQRTISCIGRFVLLEEKGELRFPDYQRDYVWSQEDKVKLIESIFDYVEIGRIVLHEEFNPNKPKETWCFEVVDGKQRLGAILGYIKDEFSVRGKLYSELSQVDQRELSNSTLIPVIEVKNLSRKQQLDLFINVNTTGVSMSKEHLDKVRKELNDAILGEQDG